MKHVGGSEYTALRLIKTVNTKIQILKKDKIVEINTHITSYSWLNKWN